VAGIPLKWEEIPKDNQRFVLIAALHCVVNGPVGVDKNTTFPLIGSAKINALVTTTNSSWRGFCVNIAKFMLTRNLKIDCNAIRLLGTYWPLKDWPKKAQGLV